MVKNVNETIKGFKEIRVLGLEKFFYEKIYDSAKELSDSYKKHQIISQSPRYFLELFLIFFFVTIVFISYDSKSENLNLLPTLGIFGLASIKLLPIANIISNSLIQIRFNRDGVERLYKDMLEFETSINKIEKNRKKNVNIEKFKKLELNNVSLITRTAEKILNNISLVIERGTSIASWSFKCRKATLLDVILGLLNPTEGSIF